MKKKEKEEKKEKERYHKTNEANIHQHPIKLMPPLDKVIDEINNRLEKLEKLYEHVGFLDTTFVSLQAKLEKYGIRKDDYTRI
ncbi:MAG: hypothetical protein V3V81_08115 [Candidatus Bathyarchaeia archaeon]